MCKIKQKKIEKTKFFKIFFYKYLVKTNVFEIIVFQEKPVPVWIRKMHQERHNQVIFWVTQLANEADLFPPIRFHGTQFFEFSLDGGRGERASRFVSTN